MRKMDDAPTTPSLSHYINKKKNLLWSQLPPPKCNIRKKDQGLPRAIKKTDTTNQIRMDIRNITEPVALRSAKRKQKNEQPT